MADLRTLLRAVESLDSGVRSHEEVAARGRKDLRLKNKKKRHHALDEARVCDFLKSVEGASE